MAAYIKQLLKDYFNYVLIVVVVSAACVSIFLLPTEIGSMLRVKTQVFNPITFISASFVHLDLAHLSNNLAVFLLVTYLLHFIYRWISEQKILHISLLIIFTVLPFLYYGVLVHYVFYAAEVFGLSLVNSGLIGLSIASLTIYFRHRIEKFIAQIFITSIIFFTFSLINLPIVFRCLFAILGFVYGTLEIEKILTYLRALCGKDRWEAFIVGFTLFFYFISIIGFFPAAIVLGGTIVDIFSHYFGLLFGISLGIITYFLKSTL